MMPRSTDSDGLEGAATASGPGDAAAVVNSAGSSSPIDPGIGERYRWIETLSAGSLDARYLARRLDTGALVELRVLSGGLASDDDLVLALRNHAVRLARVSSPAIATVYECERTASGALVLAVEQPQGATLRDTIRREGKLAPERALDLALQIAEALESAHNLGLVHGGLRPENVILVDPEQTVALTHFGLDRLLAASSAGAHDRTEMAGKDAVYQAPEQASGEATERSDIYAVGAVLYEMLAGTPPSPGATSHRRLGPYPSRMVSRNLERVIAQALELVPDRRQPHMSVVCNDLSDEINLCRQRNATRRWALAGPETGKRTVLLVACVAFAILGALAIWLAHPFATLPRSSPLPRSAPTAQRPGTPAAVTTPGPYDASRPGKAGRGNDPPRSDAAAKSPAAGGASRSSSEPAARSTSASEGAPDARITQKPQASRSSPTGAAAPRGQAGLKTSPGTDDRAAPAQPGPRAEDLAERQQPRLPAPGPQPLRQTREAGDDPGAIIDWLLTEGHRERR